MRITPFVLLVVAVVLLSHGAFAGIPIWQQGEYYVNDDTTALYHFNEESGSWAYNAEGTASLDLNVSDFNSISKYGESALDCDEDKFWGATNDSLLDANTTPGGSIDFWFYTYKDMLDGVGGRRLLLYHYADAALNNGIEIMFNDAAQGADSGKLRVVVTQAAVITELFSTNTKWVAGDWNHFRFDWNVNGKFLYVDGILNDTSAVGGWYAPGTDNNAFFCSNSGLAQRFDGKLDEFLVSSVDLNTNSGNINLNVFDENTSLPMITSTVTFNGVEYSTDDQGYLLIDLIGNDVAFGEYVMTIGEDGNYGTRYFDVNYWGQSISFNPFLLLDVNGENINFKFYDSDEATVLANAYVEVWHDLNFVSSRKTDSAGETSFFLHPDRNYHFVAFKGDGTTVRYNKVLLTVKLPKDEDTLVQLSPFDLSQRGIGSTNWSAQANDISFYVFSNTLEYYYFDVNAGFSYSNRSYALRIRGNPVTYSLQPYLAKRDESGDFIFSVKNSTTLASIEGVRIVIKKVIPGEGTVTIEEIETDSAGTATISLIFGIEYAVYFYYNDLLVHTATIRPTYAALFYQVLLDVTAIDIVPVEVGSLGVVFSPINRNMYIDDLNRIDLNVSVRFGGKEFSTMTITIKDSAGNVFDENSFTAPWTDGNTVSYRTSLGDFNSHYLLVVVVDMNSVDGNQYTASYTYSVWRSSQWNLFNRLLSFADQNNPADSKVVTSFIALFITILIVASLAGTSIIQAEPLFLSVVVLFLMLFFLTIGFVGIDIVVFLVVFAAVLALLTKAVIS